jgi:sterol 14-demethylase
MTVALSAKGNNFVLGGKLAQVSAEEAYTVSRILGSSLYPHILICFL